MDVTLTNENWQRFVEACDRAIVGDKADPEVYKSLKSRVARHFTRPVTEFKTDGLDRIGRTIVDRRIEIHRGESPSRDGYEFDVDLLVVDEYDFCYTTKEAGSPSIILTEEEILEKGKSIRNEYS